MYLRDNVQANTLILITAFILDIVVLGAFLSIKAQTDITIVYVAAVTLSAVFGSEALFLRLQPSSSSHAEHKH